MIYVRIAETEFFSVPGGTSLACWQKKYLIGDKKPCSSSVFLRLPARLFPPSPQSLTISFIYSPLRLRGRRKKGQINFYHVRQQGQTDDLFSLRRSFHCYYYIVSESYFILKSDIIFSHYALYAFGVNRFCGRYRPRKYNVFTEAAFADDYGKKISYIVHVHKYIHKGRGRAEARVNSLYASSCSFFLALEKRKVF